jgi:hypothetical protein
MDGRYYHGIQRGKYGPLARDKFEKYQGLKLWLDISNHRLIENVFFIRGCGRTGMSYNLRQGLYHGNNSGYGALNLAVALGANPIYLIGYDMKFRDGKSHYHTGHDKTGFSERSMASFPNAFYRTAPELKEKGICVYNVNTDTALRCYPIIPDLPKDLNKKPRPVYVSYYTPNSIYSKRKQKLIDSLIAHSLKYDIQEVSDQGSWLENVKHKPFFIKEMLEKHKPHPIVWVDVDAIIRQYPIKFNKLNKTFSAYFRSRRHRRTDRHEEELLSGTLYFKNNKKAVELVDLWIDQTKACPGEWDQRTLRKAFDRWSGSHYRMEPEYCCVFDGWEKRDGVKPIIEHFQYSREIRKGKYRKMYG